ncbi:predicted protein [Coccidioides posadasii str. Silveira]|uniref:Predicted protein n=2 Tax=Coccidioides posadasii TaxID=199306 RepID=E9D3Q0_COCPS|nr:predicted protein [Coccidioides posadasii str. Silveira]KMM65921.1 hypothetical protein CPAG_02262 [Coccidioides posadasii RMSCC 3488]
MSERVAINLTATIDEDELARGRAIPAYPQGVCSAHVTLLLRFRPTPLASMLPPSSIFNSLPCPQESIGATGTRNRRKPPGLDPVVLKMLKVRGKPSCLSRSSGCPSIALVVEARTCERRCLHQGTHKAPAPGFSLGGEERRLIQQKHDSDIP